MGISASKTKAAYFSLYTLLNPPADGIDIDGIQIRLRKTVNILGLTFDQKLQ